MKGRSTARKQVYEFQGLRLTAQFRTNGGRGCNVRARGSALGFIGLQVLGYRVVSRVVRSHCHAAGSNPAHAYDDFDFLCLRNQSACTVLII